MYVLRKFLRKKKFARTPLFSFLTDTSDLLWTIFASKVKFWLEGQFSPLKWEDIQQPKNGLAINLCGQNLALKMVVVSFALLLPFMRS